MGKERVTRKARRDFKILARDIPNESVLAIINRERGLRNVWQGVAALSTLAAIFAWVLR